MASLLLGGAWLNPAAAQMGPEFQVNSYTTGWQDSPAVVATGAGEFVVVWRSRVDYDLRGVFGRRFDSAGVPLGSEFRVNGDPERYTYQPAVAADGAGDFIVVWDTVVGSPRGVFGRRFDSAGVPVGSEFQVNTYSGHQDSPAVAAASAGNFVVVWQSMLQDGSLAGVFGQRFDSAGLPVGSEFRVNSYTTSYQQHPAVATDVAGNFVAVWSSLGQDGSDWGVFGQRFDSAGTAQGSEFRVNSTTVGDQYRPAVAADGAGNFVVVWDSNGQDGSYDGVFGRRYDAAGAPLGGEFRVNSYTTSGQAAPAVAADSSGNFVVAWQSLDQDGSSLGVFGQRFDSAGLPVGGEFQVNSYTSGLQFSPAVAADGAGNFDVVWESFGQDGDLAGVFGKAQFTYPFFYDGFEAGDLGAWSFVCNAGDICPILAHSVGRVGSRVCRKPPREARSGLADGCEVGDVCTWSAQVGGGTCP